MAELQNQHYRHHWTTTAEDLARKFHKRPEQWRVAACPEQGVLAFALSYPAEVEGARQVRIYAEGAALEARTALLQEVLNTLPAGIQHLESTLREDFTDARGFLEHAGFHSTHHSYGAHLDLGTFDFAPYEGLEERLFVEGFEVRNTPLQFTEALFELYREAYEDVPQVAATRWDKPDPATFAALLSQENHVWFTVLYRGQVVALTVLETSGQEVGSQLTLTSRKYRHRGLSTLVKARSLQWAKEQGFRAAGTGGAVINLGMLKVNRRLGYQIEPMWITYTRSV